MALSKAEFDRSCAYIAMLQDMARYNYAEVEYELPFGVNGNATAWRSVAAHDADIALTDLTQLLSAEYELWDGDLDIMLEVFKDDRPLHVALSRMRFGRNKLHAACKEWSQWINRLDQVERTGTWRY